MNPAEPPLTAAQKRWATRRARYGASGHIKPSAAKRGVACSVDGCGKLVKSNGVCAMHQSRIRRTGSPDVRRKAANGEHAAWVRANAGHEGDDCLVWPFPLNAHGRGIVKVGDRHMIASRYMCLLVHGEPPTPKHEAAHTCGQGHRGCMNPRHLVWKSRVENLADKLVHDTHSRGERHWNARLVAEDVREIRRLADVMSQAELAARFGVARATIANIKRRATWAWLD